MKVFTLSAMDVTGNIATELTARTGLDHDEAVRLLEEADRNGFAVCWYKPAVTVSIGPLDIEYTVQVG